MPGASNNGFSAERFAALWAGFDSGNSNEAEAVNKFRALRRMSIAENLRIIDAMGRADVMHALDLQLQPVREESPDAKAALEEAAALREELTERTTNVRQLAELLKQERETNEGLREELKAVSRQTAGCAPASSPAPQARPVSQSWVNAPVPTDWGFLRFVLFVVVLIFLLCGTLHLNLRLPGF